MAVGKDIHKLKEVWGIGRVKNGQNVIMVFEMLIGTGMCYLESQMPFWWEVKEMTVFGRPEPT